MEHPVECYPKREHTKSTLILFYSNVNVWQAWCTDRRLWTVWRNSTPDANWKAPFWPPCWCHGTFLVSESRNLCYLFLAFVHYHSKLIYGLSRPPLLNIDKYWFDDSFANFCPVWKLQFFVKILKVLDFYFWISPLTFLHG